MIYVHNSWGSDDRPKLTGRQDEETNWSQCRSQLIKFEINTIKSLGRERSNAVALSVVPFFAFRLATIFRAVNFCVACFFFATLSTDYKKKGAARSLPLRGKGVNPK